MTDIAREKYLRLMAHIGDLEDRIEDLERELENDQGKDGTPGADVIRQELIDLTEQLARGRSELSRVSDGCGKPHPMQ